MIIVSVAIQETNDGRIRIRCNRIADEHPTHQESKAMQALWPLAYALAQHVAQDFAGRFTDKPAPPQVQS